MGYRSEVKICLKKDAYEELRARLFNKESFRYMLDERFFSINEIDEDIIVCGWEDIKWYSTFEEIRIIEDYLAELESQNIEYRFIRVGEEYSDVEFKELYEDGSCDRINIYQGIDIYY